MPDEQKTPPIPVLILAGIVTAVAGGLLLDWIRAMKRETQALESED
jgi:hypothetical protein